MLHIARTLAVALLLASFGCDPSAPAVASATDVRAPAQAHQVVVFATASLRRPFTALARRYEQDNPGARVELRCEGGAALLAAVLGGASCDVIAVGDSSIMSRLASATVLASSSPAELARNRIAIVVAAGNPRGVQSLKDFARSDLRVALGARSASIGRHARWALSRLPGEVKPAVEVATADEVRERVARGEADAGIVYATTFADADADADAAARVQRIAIAEADNTPVLYSISAMREAREPRGAAAFRALALGPVGRQIMLECGFLR